MWTKAPPPQQQQNNGVYVKVSFSEYLFRTIPIWVCGGFVAGLSWPLIRLVWHWIFH